MSSEQTYFRVHVYGPDATGPEQFSADNAYSALWGSTFVEGDPSRTVCQECTGSGDGDLACPACRGDYYDDDDWCDRCDGTGLHPAGGRAPCTVCGGKGYEDLPVGYSCCDTPEDLLAYMAYHGTPGEDAWVVEFLGWRGPEDGFDGEPLVVPTAVVAWTPWPQFVAAHTAHPVAVGA